MTLKIQLYYFVSGHFIYRTEPHPWRRTELKVQFGSSFNEGSWTWRIHFWIDCWIELKRKKWTWIWQGDKDFNNHSGFGQAPRPTLPKRSIVYNSRKDNRTNCLPSVFFENCWSDRSLFFYFWRDTVFAVSLLFRIYRGNIISTVGGIVPIEIVETLVASHWGKAQKRKGNFEFMSFTHAQDVQNIRLSLQAPSYWRQWSRKNVSIVSIRRGFLQ